MPITRRHPAVLQLTRSLPVLVDPAIPYAALATVYSLVHDRPRFFRLSVVGGLAGLAVGVTLRLAVLPGSGIEPELLEISGWIVVVLSTALGVYPFYDRAHKAGLQLREFAGGPHAAPLAYVNDLGLDATDSTPGDLLWPVIQSFLVIDGLVLDLDAGEYLLEADILQQRLDAAGLTVDASAQRPVR